MGEAIVILSALGVTAVFSIGLARWRTVESRRQASHAYELHFPRDLEAVSAQQFIASLTGLLVQWWRRSLGYSHVVAFEVLATQEGIRHFLTVPDEACSFVLPQLAAALPDVALVKLAPGQSHNTPLTAVELALTTPHRSLAVSNPEGVSRALLASLQPLNRGESVWLQWVVTPHPPVDPVTPARRQAAQGWNSWRIADDLSVQFRDSESVRAARDKLSSPVFLVVGRVGASASDSLRRRALIRRVLGLF